MKDCWFGKIENCSFIKTNPNLNPNNIFQEVYILSEGSVKFCFFLTFNAIISSIFPKNFIETHDVSQKIWIFTSSISTILVNFMDFFTLKKTNDISIYKLISAVFWLGIIWDRLLNNCTKLYLYWNSTSSNIKIERS